MKMLSLFVLTFCVIGPASSQFSAREKYITGSINVAYQQQKTVSDNNNSFFLNFSPSLMKFRSAKKATGLKLLFAFQDGKQTSGSVTSDVYAYYLGAGIFATDFFPVSNKIYFALERGIGATYSFGKINFDQGLPPMPASQNTKGYNMWGYLTPEIGCKLTDRFILGINFSNILQAGVLYSHENSVSGSSANNTRLTSFYINSSLASQAVGQLGLRFSWRLK